MESNFIGETCGLAAGTDKTSGLRERICEYSAQNIRTAPKTPPISMYTGMYGSLGQSLMNCTPAKINSNTDSFVAEYKAEFRVKKQTN